MDKLKQRSIGKRSRGPMIRPRHCYIWRMSPRCPSWSLMVLLLAELGLAGCATTPIASIPPPSAVAPRPEAAPAKGFIAEGLYVPADRSFSVVVPFVKSPQAPLAALERKDVIASPRTLAIAGGRHGRHGAGREVFSVRRLCQLRGRPLASDTSSMWKSCATPGGAVPHAQAGSGTLIARYCHDFVLAYEDPSTEGPGQGFAQSDFREEPFNQHPALYYAFAQPAAGRILPDQPMSLWALRLRHRFRWDLWRWSGWRFRGDRLPNSIIANSPTRFPSP